MNYVQHKNDVNCHHVEIPIFCNYRKQIWQQIEFSVRETHIVTVQFELVLNPQSYIAFLKLNSFKQSKFYTIYPYRFLLWRCLFLWIYFKSPRITIFPFYWEKIWWSGVNWPGSCLTGFTISPFFFLRVFGYKLQAKNKGNDFLLEGDQTLLHTKIETEKEKWSSNSLISNHLSVNMKYFRLETINRNIWKVIGLQ